MIVGADERRDIYYNLSRYLGHLDVSSGLWKYDVL